MTDWDDILSAHGPLVWRTACRLLTSSADAQDCFQETFLRAWRISRTQTVRSWPALLRRLATSRAIDLLRRRVAHADRTLHLAAVDEPRDPGGDPLDALQADELAVWLRQALTRLPPREAEAVSLRLIEEMDNAEIANAMDLAVNAVAVLIHQGRRRLREMLPDSVRGGIRQ